MLLQSRRRPPPASCGQRLCACVQELFTPLHRLFACMNVRASFPAGVERWCSIGRLAVLPATLRRLAFTMSNPPFYSSAEQAARATARKWRGLRRRGGGAKRSFGGSERELWCEGGERSFVGRCQRKAPEKSTAALTYCTLIKHTAPSSTAGQPMANCPTPREQSPGTLASACGVSRVTEAARARSLKKFRSLADTAQRFAELCLCAAHSTLALLPPVRGCTFHDTFRMLTPLPLRQAHLGERGPAPARPNAHSAPSGLCQAHPRECGPAPARRALVHEPRLRRSLAAQTARRTPRGGRRERRAAAALDGEQGGARACVELPAGADTAGASRPTCGS